jgi:hypothetical protein
MTALTAALDIAESPPRANAPVLGLPACHSHGPAVAGCNGLV